MKLILAIVLTFCLVLPLHSQSKSPAFDAIKTRAEAENFVKKYPAKQAVTYDIKSIEYAAELLAPLFEQKPGFVFTIGAWSYKLIDHDSSLYHRVNYIYLDGSRLSKSEIDSLRNEILRKYKSGTTFLELVAQYTMDGNETGDTQWFAAGTMVPEFEAAVSAHKKDDIFFVDTPTKNWYHVVLKSYESSFHQNLFLLKAKLTD